MADSGTAPLLAVSELGVEFVLDAGRRTAAQDVSFAIAPGQVLALVGESGSGKSVTALALLGLLPRDARVTGSAELGGDGERPVQLIGADAATLRDVRGRRIGAVFQDPFSSFDPVQRIGRQIVEALRAHPRSRSRASGTSEDERARTLGLLRRVGLDDPDRVYASFPHELSGGQLQRAMIAMAICDEPDLLIADEPTTALDVTVQAGVLGLLHELRAELGMAILLITHDMGVVADLADEVVVLRAARIVESGDADTVFHAPRSDYTRELLGAVPRIDDPAPAFSETAREEGPPAVALRDVTVTYGAGRRRFVAVDGVSLTVPAGETVGLVGESGSGKTTIGRAIARLVPTAGGEISLAGTDLASLHGRALREARGRIGFVFQNPGDSLNPRARVADVIAEPLQIHSDVSRDERRRLAVELLERVDLPADAADRFPHQLSGGQRQRVSIARALVLRPALLIADEPTSALDVAVQATILTLIAQLQHELGFGCLFISHDLAVVRQVSRQVVVMRAGQVVESGPADDVLSRPQDPYTQRLVASIPFPDPRVQRARRAQLAARV